MLSGAWLVPLDGGEVASLDEDGTVVLQGDSDAQLTKGLVVGRLVTGRRRCASGEVVRVERAREHCGNAAGQEERRRTNGRNNGVVNMLGVVKARRPALSGGSGGLGCYSMKTKKSGAAGSAPVTTSTACRGPHRRCIRVICFAAATPEKLSDAGGRVTIELVIETASTEDDTRGGPRPPGRRFVSGKSRLAKDRGHGRRAGRRPLATSSCTFTPR